MPWRSDSPHWAAADSQQLTGHRERSGPEPVRREADQLVHLGGGALALDDAVLLRGDQVECDRATQQAGHTLLRLSGLGPGRGVGVDRGEEFLAGRDDIGDGPVVLGGASADHHDGRGGEGVAAADGVLGQLGLVQALVDKLDLRAEPVAGLPLGRALPRLAAGGADDGLDAGGGRLCNVPAGAALPHRDQAGVAVDADQVVLVIGAVSEGHLHHDEEQLLPDPGLQDAVGVVVAGGGAVRDGLGERLLDPCGQFLVILDIEAENRPRPRGSGCGAEPGRREVRRDDVELPYSCGPLSYGAAMSTNLE
jgi:hypothetical protein